MCDTIIRQDHIVHKLDLNVPIYKFMPLQYVLTLLHNQSLYFQKTDSWEDPYENFFLKQDFRMNDGTPVDATTMIKGIFGMCWTTKRESDALWRIYSPDKRAVRIRTTADKLFRTIYRDDADCSHAYIGKVIYREIAELERKLHDSVPINPLFLNEMWTQSMFVKRQEFSHEEEVRAILTFSAQEVQYNRDHLDYPINVQNFVEELTLDPRLKQDEDEEIAIRLIEAGANPDIINQSQLYAFRKQTIVFQ